MSRAAEPASARAALEAVLARLRNAAPAASRRLEAALHAALDGTRRSIWPEVAWRSSRLTNTGFPVEFSWSSQDASLRWTAEVAGPEVPESRRLAAALGVLAGLGAPAAAPAWLVPRPGQRLRFGAWLGGRHDETGDRYKLYLEPPDGLPEDVLAPAIRAALPARVVWRMAGVPVGGEGVELYGRWARPEVWEVERLLTVAELAPSPLLELAVELAGARDDLLLSGTAGLSLTTARGRVTAAGCFFHAGPQLGGDGAIAAAVRRVADRCGWQTSIYDALLASAGPARPGRHGMIGFGVTGRGARWLQIGLRP